MSKRINASDAKQLQDQGWTYLDVRTEGEFEAGHPQGAVNISFARPDFIEQVKARFQPDAKLVIGCQMGGRSMRATAALEQLGYQQLADNTGGFEGWAQAKLPFAKGKA